MTHRSTGITARKPGAPTLTGEAPPAIDHQAVQELVRRARHLYGAAYEEAAVAEVTASLATHLEDLIASCRAIAAELPADTPLGPWLQAAATTAEQELERGSGHTAMRARNHMLLLADSAQYLSARAKEAGR